MSSGFKSISSIKNLASTLKAETSIVCMWLSICKIKSFTDDELVRFAKHVTFGFEPDGQILIAKLRFHHSGQRMTESEMKDLAKQLANGDAILEEVLLWNMAFYGGRAPDAPTKRKGIWFWMVGMNASHQFFAGTDGNGKCYRYSAGEGCEVDENGTPKINVSDVQEVADWRGYYGHF